MTSKTLLITGVCQGGIGLELCRRLLDVQLVARTPISWNIILAQRNPNTLGAKDALQSLEGLATTINGTVRSYKCDLADFASIHSFVEDFKKDHDTIDVLVLNAGIWSGTTNRTVDGFDLVYQVNHLGHFLLLSLIQQKLKITERVIFVSSSLHKKADAASTLETLNEVTPSTVPSMKKYAQSKLLSAYCLSHWRRELQPTGVSVILASPGFVPTTNLNRESLWLARIVMSSVLWVFPFVRSLRQAGETLAALVTATSNDLKLPDGCYLNCDLHEERMHEDVYNSDHADIVWQWSRKSCDISTGHVS